LNLGIVPLIRVVEHQSSQKLEVKDSDTAQGTLSLHLFSSANDNPKIPQLVSTSQLTQAHQQKGKLAYCNSTFGVQVVDEGEYGDQTWR
jgi:hypothetical protein